MEHFEPPLGGSKVALIARSPSSAACVDACRLWTCHERSDVGRSVGSALHDLPSARMIGLPSGPSLLMFARWISAITASRSMPYASAFRTRRTPCQRVRQRSRRCLSTPPLPCTPRTLLRGERSGDRARLRGPRRRRVGPALGGRMLRGMADCTLWGFLLGTSSPMSLSVCLSDRGCGWRCATTSFCRLDAQVDRLSGSSRHRHRPSRRAQPCGYPTSSRSTRSRSDASTDCETPPASASPPSAGRLTCASSARASSRL